MAQEDRLAEIRKKLKEIQEINRRLREEPIYPTGTAPSSPAKEESPKIATKKEEPGSAPEDSLAARLAARIDAALARYFQEKAKNLEKRKKVESVPTVPKERLIVPQGAGSIPQREVKPATPLFRITAITEEEARKLVPPQGYFGAPREGKRRHTGVDVYLKEGTPIASPVDGVVHYSGEDKVLGKFVRVKAGDYFITFGHLKDIEPGLKPGTPVRKDESVIGYVGNTGNAAGMQPHIHLIVRRATKTGEPGEFLNPAVLFPQFRFAVW